MRRGIWMENNNRRDYDDFDKPIDAANQDKNQIPVLPNEKDIETEFISYRGYHELSSAKEEDMADENNERVNEYVEAEPLQASDDQAEIRSTREKKKRSRWLTPVITAILGGMVALGAGSYLGFVDLSGVLPGDDGPVKTAIATNDKVNDEDGLKIVDSTKTTSELIQMIEEVSPAVVGIVNIQNSTNYYDYRQPTINEESNNSQESGTGSGVIFKKTGKDAFIVTNNHVIENADTIEVSLAEGTRITAELVGTDPLTDLAVLKIDGSKVTKVAEFGDSEKLSVGEPVLAIGNPLGLDFSGSVTQGIISGLQRTVTVATSAGEWDMDAIQTDAAINPGNSGGALVNSDGQVIGINSMKISSEEVEGIGFAIPSKDVSDIVNDLLADGKVQRPYIGVGLQSISEIPQYVLQQQLNLPSEITSGVLVTQVETGSPAAEAGIEAKDVVVAINDAEVTTLGEFRKYLYSNAANGDMVKIKLYRNGVEKTVSVTVTEK